MSWTLAVVIATICALTVCATSERADAGLDQWCNDWTLDNPHTHIYSYTNHNTHAYTHVRMCANTCKIQITNLITENENVGWHSFFPFPNLGEYICLQIIFTYSVLSSEFVEILRQLFSYMSHFMFICLRTSPYVHLITHTYLRPLWICFWWVGWVFM